MPDSLEVPEAALVIDQQESGEAVVLCVVGEIDQVTCAQFADAVAEAVEHPRLRRIEIDLSKVSFMDSAGINALVRCHAAADRRGRSLVVMNPHPDVRRVLDICGLLELLS
jgi:anti-anti-sigma factor